VEADDGYLLDRMMAGDLAALAEAAEIVAGFPEGQDACGNSWVGQAVAIAPRPVVDWILARGVPLARREGQPDPVLHHAIDRQGPDRHEVLAALIAAGVPLDERGPNDWSALHLAALRDDLVALEMLLMAGADPAARTNCDDYATPEEEARHLGHRAAADFLRDWRHPLAGT